MENWIGTTLSVVAGGALTMASGWLADRRLSKRDRERRREERQERLTARRNEFQRETLLALQVVSQKLMRNAGACFHQDMMAHRATGEWRKRLLPEGLAEENLHLTNEMMLVASRIRDDEVRALADKFRNQMVAASMTTTELEAQDRIILASQVQQTILQRTGQLIRELDEIAV